MASFDFLNGSHIECIDTDNNTTKRSSNAYKPLTFSTANHDNDKNLLSWLDQITEDFNSAWTLKPIENPTLNITIKDSESNTLTLTNEKKYIDHCEELLSKVYTNKTNKNKSNIKSCLIIDPNDEYKSVFDDLTNKINKINISNLNDTKGEKEMTKTKPNPRNYTILPEIDDYKVYKDKQGRDVAIVVTFTDGTKTKAVCNYDEGDKFDIQSGIAICFMRRLLGDVNIDPKTLDKDERKKSLGYTEYNRFMRKTIRNHEKKIKQAEKEKEKKAKELKERQEIDAKRSEKRKKEEMEKLSPIIDILKGLNLNDAVETLKNMANDNK